MKSLDSTESDIKYCQRLVSEIKSRQNIKASKIKLNENFSGSTLTVSFPTFDTKRVRVIFTPTDDNNQYSELGTRIYITPPLNAPFFEIDIASDPSYANNQTVQAWLISLNNGYGTPASANINCSVNSPSSGTVTMAEI